MTERIAIAMSGGLDSSVAAALLSQANRPVFGLMLRLWSAGNGRENRCCSPSDLQAARRVAHLLGIPFYVLDVREAFKERVVDYFVQGYASGITPNPCLQCNRHIRWELMLDHARALGATHMATGHYARVERHNGRVRLKRAIDQNKDQSYVLSVLNQDQLSRTLLPLSELHKNEVRRIAQEMHLPFADRGESQDLCFLGGQDYRTFLRDLSEVQAPPGAILDRDGNQIGEHQGLPYYTLGQRKGLGISSSKALYVIRKDRLRNALVLGEANERGSSGFDVHSMNWVSGTPPSNSIRATVQIRYRAEEMDAEIRPIDDGSRIHVELDHPLNDVTPGQAAVLYREEECLGGGIIQA